ncbi:hypothetical protein J5X98_22770 [Leptothermofonsia sichuanensis E412]|jgi:hypothetical protein|uniref:hypothetical protein n=1 Tax=Leptothermofonsia sichuanensis TaxID=2917832 RepID=UPI001CA64BF3|nr:hypothetical protein [Leptothermofonsia sichuanensis]QZZ20076.1 hypothetical protein J5X98_22770 [Leptothermofonsia sichuanensis E412]
MSKPNADQSDLPDQESLESMNIDQWIENLRRADRSFYNMMALEVWSIAKTMDGLIPGFWNRFMTNRQTALKQFMQQKNLHHSREVSNGESEE